MEINPIYIQPKIKSSNIILLILFIAMMGDYCLTYFGINKLKLIEEGNPLMVGIMALPFHRGLLIRLFTSGVLVLLLKFVEKGFEPRKYRFLLTVVLLIQVFPYTLHLIWMSKGFPLLFLYFSDIMK